MHSAAAATSRNRQLDGLRGYAAAAVVVYHSILNIDTTQIQRILSPSFRTIDGTYAWLTKIALAIFNGEAAVVIFFIMSGAVLLQSLQRDTGSNPAIAVRFIVRRLLRIYPALVACLLIAALLYPFVNRPGGLSPFLTNLALTDFPLIGASWTLQVEVLAAPLLLIGGLVFRRWKELGLLLYVVIVLSLMRHSPLGRIAPNFSWYVLCFALGMFIPTTWGALLARLTPVWSWPLFLLIVLFAKHVMLFGSFNTTASIQHVGAALLVNAVFHGRARGLDSVLSKAISVFLGRISYTLYLANVILLDTITVALSSYPPAASHPLEAGLLVGPLIILLTIPIAYVLTISVEEPAIRLGRWLTTPLRTMPPTATAAYPPPS